MYIIILKQITQVRDDPKHYMNMHKNKAPLLSHYLPEATLSQEMLLSWEGMYSFFLLTVVNPSHP